MLNMEEKTGCVRRDMQCRKAASSILSAAQELAANENEHVAALARVIVEAAKGFEE